MNTISHMRRTSFSKIIKYFGIFGLLLPMACSKHEPIPEIYEPNKCFEGMIIGTDCPSYLFIQVINGDIGKKWVIGNKVYENAITIQNYPNDSLHQSIISSKKVFFTIDVERTKNSDLCVNNFRPCPSIIYYESYPETKVCIKSISNLNCENHER